MRSVRLLRTLSQTVIVMPVRHGNRVKEAIKLGVKRPSKANTHKSVPRMKAKTIGTIDVRKGMSFSELGQHIKIDDEELFEIARKIDPLLKLENLSKPVMTVERLRDVASLFGYKVNYTKQLNEEELLESADVEDEYPRPVSDSSLLQPRAPVVTIMGHVDHGKTTLLDALRKSRIVDSEFGGITQHIGAFSVRLSSMEGSPRITFLDTPGHAAFSAMRQRGANCTDVVVLVVAADDGVMPQTLESVRYAASAKVPIIVAINKIDAPNADPEKVTSELAYKAGLVLEESGGDVQCVKISALKRQNLDALQEAIIVQSDVMDLRAETTGPVQAVILEAETKKGRGKVATCLVQRGCLKPGSFLIAGTAVCRVRAIFSDGGRRLKSAGPSEPVEVMGWRELPDTGDVVLEVRDEARAIEVQELRTAQVTEEKVEEDARAYTETMAEYRHRYQEWLSDLNQSGMNNAWGRRHLRHQRPSRDRHSEEDEIPKQNIIVKGDVLGSVEAISDAISQVQSSRQFELNLVDQDVGEITNTDIELAEAFDAIIYVFNIPVGKKTRELAEKAEVEIREFNVIYHLMHDLRDQVTSIIPAISEEKELGRGTILKMFMVSQDGKKKKVPVAGCICESGTLRHDALFRVYRTSEPSEESLAEDVEDDDGDDEEEDEDLIFDGPCESLYRGNQKTKAVPQKAQCGVMLLGSKNLDQESWGNGEVEEDSLDLQPGDKIVCYEVTTEVPELDVDFDIF